MEKSERNLTAKQRLVRSAIHYVVVCLFLTFVNIKVTPHYFWVLWVWAGWGLSVILQIVDYIMFIRKDRADL